MKNTVAAGTLGSRIREYRIMKGLTQIDLSKGLCTPSLISQIESDRARPSYKILNGIATKLDVPLETLSEDLDFDLKETSMWKMAEAMMADHQFVSAIPLLQSLLDEKYLRVSHRELMFKTGVCHRHAGDLVLADQWITKTIHEAISRAEIDLQIDCMVELALLSVAKKDFFVAVSQLERALSLLPKSEKKDPVVEATLYGHLADLYSLLGRREKAIEFFAKAQALWDEFEHPKKLAQLYLKMATEHHHSDDFKTTIYYAEKARTLFRSLEESLASAHAKLTMADALMKEGRLLEARTHLELVAQTATTCGDKTLHGSGQARLAQIAWQQGKWEEALVTCNEACILLPADHSDHALVFQVRAQVASQQDQMDQALTYLKKAAQIHWNNEQYRGWNDVMQSLSELYRQNGDVHEALRIKDEMYEKMNIVLRNYGVIL